MSNRAWVTLATNDSYGLGALVLAHSLRRANTAHPAVVLITPSVTEAMRNRLSAVFAEVITVNVLDSQDAAHLALLQRPELGITFTKIHCWTLTQYEKCVFLDADTLIVQNCDELFDREELSAAPDVGWPDCFNSGVFVYKPSQDTYAKLIKFAQERGSFDGGDQGLLNAFFADWAHGDINKHLPFLYNVTSAAFYSYIPALKHYGQDLKIIHFIGAAKPWLQQFNWESRSVDAPEHLSQFLQLWWDLFVGQVHPQLDTAMSGVAGNLARVTVSSGTYQREAIDELTRRQGWEAGNIDYMGADSFDNIWAKISQTLNQQPPKQPSPPRKEPTPPKEPVPAPAPVEAPEPASAPVEAPAPTPAPVEAPTPAPAAAEAPVQVATPAPVETPVAPAPVEAPATPAPVEAPAPTPAPVEAPVLAPAPVEAPKEQAPQKTEPTVPPTPPATPKSSPEASSPVTEAAPEAPKASAPAPASPAPAAEAPAAVEPAQPAATPEKPQDTSATSSTDSPPLANTPSKEEAPAVSPSKLEERRKPVQKLQLHPPAGPDPCATPDSEMEDAAALAHAIIASELSTSVTAPTPSADACSPPPLQEKRLSVEAPEAPSPPVSLAQIGVKPKGKPTTAAQIESSITETAPTVEAKPAAPQTPAEAPSAPQTPASPAPESPTPATPTSPTTPAPPGEKKKSVKKASKKEAGSSGDVPTPVPPPRKKEKKPKEK